jgi:phage tail sheath protein FI
VATTPREINSYSHNSVLEAIDMVSDVDDLEFNILTAPGVTQTALTDKVIDICEERGDALGIIDIENVFTPQHESTDSYTTRLGSVKDAVSNLKDRQINSSYGATYYPWTQIKDSINGNLLYSPPSVIALGAMGSSEAASELWFAPAGFNRGGLSTGKAGLAVTNVTEKVNSKDRDKLYEANINPIASFPNEGIVIFGQKTLQIEQSALDRINVRRLMIHVKKEISRMATKVLFDPNVQVTWNRFLSMVEPFLRSVKTRLGLTDFKVILDDTTTTADLVDRNVMYAKIFLKPARAIEYIAIDFNITSTGAGFED